jgi:hypothetical protein
LALCREPKRKEIKNKEREKTNKKVLPYYSKSNHACIKNTFVFHVMIITFRSLFIKNKTFCSILSKTILPRDLHTNITFGALQNFSQVPIPIFFRNIKRYSD